ncbi:unnamed protein product, partial [Effrenium voratum]
ATHGAILWAILRRTCALMMAGHRCIVLDVPLLLKFPLLRRLFLSAVLVVVVSPEVQLARLMSRNELSEEEAKKKIAAQLSAEAQRKLADEVIENNGTQEDLRRAVADFRRAAVRGWPASVVCVTLAAGLVAGAALVKAGTSAASAVGCLSLAAVAVCMA